MPDTRIIARDGSYYILARDVAEGDLLDLEGDSIADPNNDQTGPDGHYYGFAYAYAEVTEPSTWEGTGCVVIHTDEGSFGFPPDYEIETTLDTKDGELQP